MQKTSVLKSNFLITEHYFWVNIFYLCYIICSFLSIFDKIRLLKTIILVFGTYEYFRILSQLCIFVRIF